MTTITKQQIKAIFGMLSKTHIEKEHAVRSATGGRTESMRDMTYDEADRLKRALAQIAAPVVNEKDAANKMRRKILSCCHEMNYPKSGGKLIMSYVDQKVAELGYLKDQNKTRLNDYSLSELPILVTQFERIKDSYLNKRKREYLNK